MFANFGGGSPLPEIGHSLRFNSADSAYLSRTFGTPTNGAKWALSFWVKRGTISTLQCLLGTGTVAGNMMALDFSAANQLQIYYPNTGANLNCLTNAVFRDPAAWLHIFVYFDSANGTTADRLQIWVNGVRQTFSTATYPSAATGFNSAANHQFGRHPVTGSQFDGYMSRIAFIDNPSGVTASSFAYTDPNGQWRTKSAGACKAVVDAGGNNSFMLDFDDGPSTTTLGNDYSSKNNDWTLTNFTRSAGVNDDWMTDTPTNNYCTISPVALGNGNISDGALKVSGSSGAVNSYRFGTQAIKVKTYFEFVATTIGTIGGVGIAPSGASAAVPSIMPLGAYYLMTGSKRLNGTTSAYGSSYTANDLIGVAIDPTAETITFYKNNISQGTISLTGYFSNEMVPFGGFDDFGSPVVIWNFGQRAFTYTPPTGFKALCTANLPVPSIIQPNKHFDVKTYTGITGNQTVAGLDFTLDMIWGKSRSSADSHVIQDRVRGFTNFLQSDTTSGDLNNGGGDYQNFTATGFDVIGDNARTGANGSTYVAWAWKANGAGVSNTAGSITSTVSANQTAGFSIVTYTGTGANATVGHGLGVAPKFIIVKQRSSVNDWPVYHANQNATPQNGLIYLNVTNAYAAAANVWNSTAPTSSVFSVGTNGAVNGNTATYVAYCFAEISGYSKFGSYTGNGSADGPFVWCGFRPKYVLVKNASISSNWYVWDTARGTYNASTPELHPNLANAEGGTGDLDITANGFKLRNSADAGINGSANTIIFAAFAEAPFKYANAR